MRRCDYRLKRGPPRKFPRSHIAANLVFKMSTTNISGTFCFTEYEEYEDCKRSLGYPDMAFSVSRPNFSWPRRLDCPWRVKAKFHYASWLGASSEPASVMEFGFNFATDMLQTRFYIVYNLRKPYGWLVGWLEFNVPFQHKYGYIRDDETHTLNLIFL